MLFHHTIEATDNAEDPMWYVVIGGDELEGHDGTAADYGREVLENWIADNPEQPIADEYGNPYMRVLVRFSNEPDEQANIAATVGSDNLDTPTAELDAVDAACDAKLYAKHLAYRADAQLERALMAARAAGSGANELARRVDGVISRPVALTMMRP